MKCEQEDRMAYEQSGAKMRAESNHLYHVEAQRKERDTYLTLVCRCT